MYVSNKQATAHARFSIFNGCSPCKARASMKWYLLLGLGFVAPFLWVWPLGTLRARRSPIRKSSISLHGFHSSHFQVPEEDGLDELLGPLHLSCSQADPRLQILKYKQKNNACWLVGLLTCWRPGWYAYSRIIYSGPYNSINQMKLPWIAQQWKAGAVPSPGGYTSAASSYVRFRPRSHTYSARARTEVGQPGCAPNWSVLQTLAWRFKSLPLLFGPRRTGKGKKKGSFFGHRRSNLVEKQSNVWNLSKHTILV